MDVEKSTPWLPMPYVARQEWSKVHVNPLTACAVYIQSVLMGHGAIIVGYGAGYTWFTWFAHITAIVTAAAVPVFLAGMLHGGPRFNSSPVFVVVTLVQGVLSTLSAAVVLTGPVEFSMFGSRLITLLVFGLITFFLGLASAMSPAPGAMPATPYRSMAAPLMTAGDLAMRFMNAFSDVSMVRIILDQAKDGCFWFGRRIPCSRYKWLAYTTGALSGAHFLSTIARLVQQPRATQSEFKTWGMAVAVVVASIAELGNVAVVLLKLGSDTRHPDVAAHSGTAQRLRTDIAFEAVSCVLSVSAVVVDVVGVQRLLAALKRVAVSVRRVSAHAFPAASGRGGQKAGARAQPCEHFADHPSRAEPGDADIIASANGYGGAEGLALSAEASGACAGGVSMSGPASGHHV